MNLSNLVKNTYSRILIHQFDPSVESPGGIDSCIRGLIAYSPESESLLIVGVDSSGGHSEVKLGKVRRETIGDVSFDFLPVARVDPGNQKRFLPHSLKLAFGIARFWDRIPKRPALQSHRADIGAFLTIFRPKQKFIYFIHTQENGLTGSDSDSFWRHLRRLHALLEVVAIRKARLIVVFNENFANSLKVRNTRVHFSPTWFDPKLFKASASVQQPPRIVWIGRLEPPKNPLLAVDSFSQLCRNNPDFDGVLKIYGSGTLDSMLRQRISALEDSISERIELVGRVSREHVAKSLSEASVFLMTSVTGYEGYPRVLVEALASSTPCVVTTGSDTGGLVIDGLTGFKVEQNPESIAPALQRALQLDRMKVSQRVEYLSAERVVSRLFQLSLLDVNHE